MIRRWLAFLVLLFALPVFAQQGDKNEAAEKQRKAAILIDQVIADTPNLKLGENRAIVYATLGNIGWKNDPAAGRAFFENAIAELVAAQALAEATRKAMSAQSDLLQGQTVRPQILNIIARHDAEMALTALVKTRPIAVNDALRYQAGKGQKISNYSQYNYLAQNEFNLEQSFMRMAAEQKPEKAAKLLKDSLKKGISGETLNLLKKLYEKDPLAAASIGSEIADKLIKGKFLTANDQPDNAAINAATTFLTDFIRERNPNDKSFTFDESQMRTLAERLIAFQLDQGASYGYYAGSLIQVAEKFAPAAVERLKQTQRNSRGFQSDYNPELQKLLGADTTPEQLLAMAKRYPPNSQSRIYQTAAQKYAQAGDMALARQVIEDNFSDGPLESALASLDWQYVSNLQNNGKFAEAEHLIDEMPEVNRISALVNLANIAFDKDPVENQNYAVSVLTKARLLIGDKPENSTEMSNTLQIISALAKIDETQAFSQMESLLPQINEITDAAVVFTQFQGNSQIRQGEIVMSQGGSFGVYLDYGVFQTLIKKDFERTVNLIGAFSRIETRIRLRLQLAENGLN